MNIDTTIELNGTEIKVVGNYQPMESDTRETPGCGAQFEIEELTIGDVCVMELLEDKWFEIEEIVITKINER